MGDHRDVNTIEELVELWVRSKLATEQMAADHVRAYRENFLDSSPLPDTITAFCSYLVSAGALTPWQCQMLRNGKWKGFYLDRYEIVDQLRREDGLIQCLARDTEKDTYVQLSIVTPPHATGPRVQYTVDREFS
ncbi:hypothetical protein [Aeoliella sp.]|uniref:hypothetical protein n=1 Tax=Aeoliella sp. TaxID=2795800 RepID=UPI003CCC3F77